VWTTTRPLTTFRSFPEFTSGIDLNYKQLHGKFPELSLYAQPGDELLPPPRSHVVREYRQVIGAHLNWPISLSDEIGLSVQHAEVKHSDEDQTLFGFNARKMFGRFQIETEATYAHLAGANPLRVRDREWGVYVLGVYALSNRWHVMARQEYFLDRESTGSSRNTLLGISYKPEPPIVWKLEYVKQDGIRLDIDTGLYASFSVLF
jgi:hypothetical protein